MSERFDHHATERHVHHIGNIINTAGLAQQREPDLQLVIGHGCAHRQVEISPFAQPRIVKGAFPDLIVMLKLNAHHP
ncbi:hypothetical protein D3C86_1944710 [compost metagenome]